MGFLLYTIISTIIKGLWPLIEMIIGVVVAAGACILFILIFLGSLILELICLILGKDNPYPLQ